MGVPILGGWGGVWQRGKNSHVLSFFVLESLPNCDMTVSIETFAVVSKEACTSCVATWTTLTVDRDSDSDSYFSCSETKSWKQGCHLILDLDSRWDLPTTGLYWVSRVSIWGSFFLSLCGRGPTWNRLFMCSMKAHLIPSVSHRDRSWGHTRWGWWCCWRWGWRRHSRVCLFLSRRLGPSVPLRLRLQIVRVVWRSCLLVICCIAFSWFLLDIEKSELWSGLQLCLAL